MVICPLHLHHRKAKCPYPKCPPLQLFSTRIPCGHLTDVHAEYWNTMSATSARKQKKIIRKRERTSAGIPVGQFCGRSGHLSDFLFQFFSSAGILCGRPLECPSDVCKMSVGRPQNVRWTSARMSVGRPPECPSDVRQNVRRTSARMSAGCPLECVGHQPECPMDVCWTSAISAQKNVCENSVRVTSPFV